MKKLLTLIIFSTLYSIAPTHGEVQPPNYNFSLESLEFFRPGKTLESIQAKYGKGDLVKSDDQGKVYQFYVAQIRYKFPVLVRIKEGKSVDFHARLPTYFSHDLFHQALINRYGKQDRYFKHESNALYFWNNKDGVKHTYSGTCTITCFPIFYAMSQFPLPDGHIPLTDSMILPKPQSVPGQ